MNAGTLRGLGITCLVVAAVLFYIAWDRYSTNASNVRAFNAFVQNTPLKETMGAQGLTPAMPTETKYCLLCGIIAAVGGGIFLVRAGSARTVPPAA